MKILLLTFLLFLCTSCFSQEKGVKYFFSKEVNARINDHIKEASVENENKFYITVRRRTRFENKGNYVVYVNAYKDQPAEFIEELIKVTGRYYLYENQKIPIVFDYDFDFISYGGDEKGRPLRKLDMNHSYLFIEFDPKGKVVETGN